MSDNTITINHTKENTLQFDLEIDGGVSIDDVRVKFIIETKKVDLSFNAKKEKGGKQWVVKIPQLSLLERTAYDYHICVIVDGYYFEPLKGVVNVVGTAEVYTTTPKNVTLKPSKTEDKQSESKKKPLKNKRVSERLNPREKPIEQIARELMEQQKYSKEHIDEKLEEIQEKVNNPSKTKDEEVLAILEEFGIKPKKKARVSFVRTKLLN